MEKLKLYTIVKGSTDNTLKTGDIVWLSENGDLNICNGNGWLPKDEWNTPKTSDFKVEPCKEYYLDISDGHETVKKLK